MSYSEAELRKMFAEMKEPSPLDLPLDQQQSSPSLVASAAAAAGACGRAIGESGAVQAPGHSLLRCHFKGGANVHIFTPGQDRCECGFAEAPDYWRGLAGAPVADAGTGLLPDENRIMNLAVELWNAWCRLPVQHPDDQRTVADAVHRVQDLLATRIARRQFPRGWPVKP